MPNPMPNPMPNSMPKIMILYIVNFEMTSKGQVLSTYPKPESGILLHWPEERSGCLRDAIGSFLRKEPLMPEQFNFLKDYFQHWANYPYWRIFPHQTVLLDSLRRSISLAENVDDLDNWLDQALVLGIDPL